MNSILTYIAGLIVVLLFAALVGPGLVDWNQFREGIEAQASEVAGLPVSIGGDIRFRVLPAPHMSLGKVKIGNAPGTSEAYLATFDEVDAEIALAPLLGGDVEVTSVRVVRPQIHLEVLADGTGNWKSLTKADMTDDAGMFSLASISLEKARFENGTIRYVNRVKDRSWTAEEVNGDVVATSLLGPMRAEFDAVVNEVPLFVQIGFGSFANRKAFPVTADVELRNRPVKFLFSGVATGFSLDARVDGNGRLEVDTEEEGGKTPIRVDAGMVFSSQAMSLHKLSVVTAGTMLSGSGEMRWERRPTFSLDLSAENFSLDPLLDRMTATGADNAMPLAPFLALPRPDWIDGKIDVAVSTLTMRDVLVRDAALEIGLNRGVADVTVLRGELGGATKIAVTGKLADNDGVPRFDGNIEATSGNIAALAHWLSSLAENGETQSATQARRGARSNRPFAATARLRLTPDEWALTEIAGAYAQTANPAELRGEAGYKTGGERPQLSLMLRTADFDFDPLIALLPETADPLAFLDAHDFKLALRATRLRAFGQAVRGVDADAALTGGTLSVVKLAIDDIAGAKLSFAGDLAGITTGRRDDVEGNFSGTIEAERFGGLLGLGGFDVPDIEGPVMLALTGASGEADDSAARVDTLTLKGEVRGSRVDGVVKRRHEASGGIGKIDIVANAANDEGHVLLEQLGLSPRNGITAPGSVSVRLDGGKDGEYQANFRFNLGGATLTANGKVADPFEALKFNGRADITASGVLSVFAAFGAPQPLTDWVGRQAAGPGFVFSSGVVWDKQSLSLSGMESVAGNFRLSGDATWRAADGDKLPSLTGKLEANVLDLTSLASAADETWPAAALDWSHLAAFDAEADLKAGAVRLGPLAFNNVTTRLSLSHGVLSASPFVGTFADGRASLSARIEGGTGEPGIGLNVLIEDADIAQAGIRLFGAAPGKGKADVSVQVQAQGRSWLALVSSASGTGKLALRDAAFAPLDLEGFSEGLAALTSIDDFPALVDGALRQDETDVRDVESDLTLADGVFHFTDETATLDGGTAKLAAVYDLPRLASDAEATITLDAPEGAPSFAIVAAGRNGAMKVQVQTQRLENFIAGRILAESVKETGADVPAELRELMNLPETRAALPTPLPRPSLAE